MDVYLISVRSPDPEAEQSAPVTLQEILGRRLSSSPPSSLAVLAALAPEGVRIRAVDEDVADPDLDARPDLVGLSFPTVGAPHAYELAARFRSRSIPVVMGGAHASLLPDEARLHADHVLIGEAEETWPSFLRDFAAGRAKPVYAGRPCPAEAIPLPRWEVYAGGSYLARTLQASRGCPHNCDFCANIRLSDRRLRLRPPDQVIRELSLELAKPGPRLVFIVDNDLFADADWSLSLVDRLADLGIDWWGFASVRAASQPGLVRRLARSGCRQLIVGFESLSERSLAGAGKTANRPDAYAETVDVLQGEGIAVNASFVVGMDGDGPDIFERTARFVEDLNIVMANVNIATPYPGTAFYDRLEREGRLLHRRWDLYDRTHVCFKPALMSADELAAGYRSLALALNGPKSVYRRLGAFLASAPTGPPFRSMASPAGLKQRPPASGLRFLRQTRPADWLFYIRLLASRRLGPGPRRLYYAAAGFLARRVFFRRLKSSRRI